MIKNPYYHEKRFINPSNIEIYFIKYLVNEPLESNFNNFDKPDTWKVPIYELDKNDPNNNGVRNYNFITWMTIYPFQNTLKYLGKWPSDELNSLQGEIKIRINYSNFLYFLIFLDYNVELFEGKKYLIIAQIGTFGIRNMFLSFLYFTIGTVLLALSLIFFVYYRIYVKTHEEYPLNYQNNQNQTFESANSQNTV